MSASCSPISAFVVGVMMGDQDPGQVHAVGLQRVGQVAGRVGRDDHHALAGFTVADQIGEIAHLRRNHVSGGEVAAGEQLTEVQAVL